LNFPILREGVRTLNDGGKDLINYIPKRSFSAIGCSPIESTRVLGITTGLVKESKNLSLAQQLTLLQEKRSDMPGALSTTFLAIGTFAESRDEGSTIRLFGNTPWTYSCCVDSYYWTAYNGQIRERNVVFGGFGSAGFYVDSNRYSFYHSNDCVGTAGVRKIS
jgi:hypothetical protein